MLLNVYICGEKAICCTLWKLEIFFNKYATFVCNTCMNITCYFDFVWGGKKTNTKGHIFCLINKIPYTYKTTLHCVALLITIEILKFQYWVFFHWPEISSVKTDSIALQIRDLQVLVIDSEKTEVTFYFSDVKIVRRETRRLWWIYFTVWYFIFPNGCLLTVPLYHQSQFIENTALI